MQTVVQFSSLWVAKLKNLFFGAFVSWLRMQCIRHADCCKSPSGGVAALPKISIGKIVGATSRKIIRCFERVILLLSLLVPVSDINRLRLEGWRRISPSLVPNNLKWTLVASLAGIRDCLPQMTQSKSARVAKYKQNEWFKQRLCEFYRNR